MDTFYLCAQAILPLVLFIGLGCAFRSFKLVSPDCLSGLRKLSVSFFMPFSLFQSIRKADFSSAFSPKIIILSSLASLGMFILLSIIVPKCCSRKTAPTLIHGFFASNTSVVGIPLAAQLLNENALAQFSLLVSVLTMVNVCCAVVNHYRFAETKSITPGRFVLTVIKTPMLIGALIGLVFSLLKIQLPELIEKPFASLAAACGPISLIALGGSFTFGLSKIRPVTIACIGKLLVMPLVHLGLAALFSLSQGETLAIMLAAVCPSAMLSQIMSETISGDGEMGAQIVVYSTVFSMVTIFGWLMLLL